SLEAREEPSRLARWLSPLLAFIAVVVLGLALFALLDRNPWQALHVFFVRPVASLYGMGELLQKAGALALCAIRLAIGYRAHCWTIGAEGHFVRGAVFGGGLALAFHDSTSPLLLPAMIVAGALGGMLWAAIPALLRTRLNANEILVSLMLVYVAAHL